MSRVCSVCGRPLKSLAELEGELGEPAIWLFQEFLKWKRMRENEGKNESGTSSGKI